MPHAQLNGTAALLGHTLPVNLLPSAYQEPQAESIVRSQAQPVFRPEAHIPAQTQALSQAQRLSTAFPRQFLPNQYPPQSFMAAQQAAHLAPGITVSNFQPSFPVQPSPVRPIASQTFTPAAAPSSAAATPASWLAARSSPIVSEAHLPSPAARPAPEAAYANDSHPQSMHEDSDAGTEEFETAHEDRVVHAEYRELVEQAKQWLPVPYRGDGPPLAFVFDDPPSADGNDADDAGGAVKRKRVMVDGYEMEEDGEDGMNVSFCLSICHSTAHLVCLFVKSLAVFSAHFACLLIVPWWHILGHSACWCETDIVCRMALHRLLELS